jgi:hypothetical protein
MPESLDIILPRDMPLPLRIAEVKRQITEWTKSLDEPFNFRTDALQLVKCELVEEGYRYAYLIERDVKVPEKSAASPNRSPAPKAKRG